MTKMTHQARFTRSGAKFVALCAAAALSACMAVGCQAEDLDAPDEAPQKEAPARVAAVSVGAEAPDVALTSFDGETKAISDFGGKATILSFWATWCPYCIKEMPDLQKIRENYPDVNVVMVNCGEDKATVKAFAEKKGYDFFWALDESGDAMMAYPSSGIPYTVVIGADGEVAAIFEGSGADMYSKFEAAVKEAE